jgi:hypothetical protein
MNILWDFHQGVWNINIITTIQNFFLVEDNASMLKFIKCGFLLLLCRCNWSLKWTLRGNQDQQELNMVHSMGSYFFESLLTWYLLSLFHVLNCDGFPGNWLSSILQVQKSWILFTCSRLYSFRTALTSCTLETTVHFQYIGKLLSTHLLIVMACWICDRNCL